MMMIIIDSMLKFYYFVFRFEIRFYASFEVDHLFDFVIFRYLFFVHRNNKHNFVPIFLHRN